jgi:hypothetical protein
MKMGSNGELVSISGVTDARWEMILIGGSHLSTGEREGESTLSGIWPSGPWAVCSAGPNSFPAAFSYFLFSFLFFFFFFLD